MFDHINMIAVIGTSFFMMASATVWFSPLMFGRFWLASLRATEAEIESTRKNVVRYMFLNFAFFVAAVYVLAHVVQKITLLQMELLSTAAAMAVLAIAMIGSITLWEAKGKVNFLINAGFYAYFVIVSMYLVALWPW